jgi:large subunit ribosomal protein L18
MATRKPRTVLYRRKREGKTSYSKRLKLIKSSKSRLVVRFTNQRVIGQVIDFTETGDHVIAGVDSFSLKKEGWKHSGKNLPAAYLTGLMLGKSALKADCKEVILDTGFKSFLKGGKVAAFLKGVVDSGLNVPHGSDDIFPSEDRILGKHINDNLSTDVEKIKQKIMS